MPFYEPVMYTLLALFLTLALFNKKVLGAIVGLAFATVMTFNLGLNYQESSMLNTVIVLVNQVCYTLLAVYLSYKAGIEEAQSVAESEPLPLDTLHHNE